jgi:hypothetical protein
MGSKFSMEQMITTLSARSRMTSSSYSFHPISDCSTSTSCTGEMSKPLAMMAAYSSALNAVPPPDPPRVKLGRMMAGRPFSGR